MLLQSNFHTNENAQRICQTDLECTGAEIVYSTSKKDYATTAKSE